MNDMLYASISPDMSLGSSRSRASVSLIACVYVLAADKVITGKILVIAVTVFPVSYLSCYVLKPNQFHSPSSSKLREMVAMSSLLSACRRSSSS